MVRGLYHFIHALLSFTAERLCFCVLDYAFSNATAIQEFTEFTEFPRNVGHMGERERENGGKGILFFFLVPFKLRTFSIT